MNGIDIASYQTGIDLTRVPCDFVIIKATQGTRYKNPDFSRAYEQAKAAGKRIGMYHYASKGGWAKEAQHFLDVVGNREGILVLDWERGDNANWGNVEYAGMFLSYVAKHTRRTPFIYMSKSVCREFDWSLVAPSYPLWVAQYANNVATGYQKNPWTDKKGHGAWDRARIFQYTSCGRLEGWSGRLDLNLSDLTEAEWDFYATGKETVKEDRPAYAAVVTASALNVRTGASAHYAMYQAGGAPLRLPQGMVVAICEEKNGWGRISNINGWVSLKYLR